MAHATLPNGLRMCYESDGDGPPVVLIHGLGGSHAMWRYQVPALADRYRVIALDLRGHGQSDKPPGPYSVPQFAEDVLQLLDTLDVPQATMVGLSLGGGTVQTFAIAYPERVRALGLISTSPEFTPKSAEHFYVRAELAEREGMEPLVDTLIKPRFTPEWLAEHPEVREWSAAATRANDPRAWAASARANATRSLTGELHRITCPVLFVGGERDPADMARSVELYRRHLPQAEIHMLPDVAHLLPFQAPEVFNPILRAFLDRVHAPAA